jgi:hypothetical protein
MLVLVALARATAAQDLGGGIRGSVVSHGQPVGQALIEARGQSGRITVQSATAASDGFYVLRDLPPGIYNLKVTATGLRSAEIHEVQIDIATVRLPAIPLEIGLFIDCGLARSPAFYRPSTGVAESGAVGGVVVSDRAMPVQGATVSLYMKGKGRIESQKTTDGGRFDFTGLQVHSDEYWLSIESEGCFTEEEPHLLVLPGFESVYSPITIESCSPGHCQPHLKTIRVIPPCA